MELTTMLTLICHANFVGEILLVEFEDGSEPIYLEWIGGDFGGWYPASNLEQAKKSWQKQMNGEIELLERGKIEYISLKLSSPRIFSQTEVSDSHKSVCREEEIPRLKAHHAAFVAEMEFTLDPDEYPELWR